MLDLPSRIDFSAEPAVPISLLAKLCYAVGLDPADVAEIYASPTDITFRVFLRNERGSFYLNEDRSDAAQDTLHFRVDGRPR